MRWDNFNDGGNNLIDTGQIVHVGWSTADHASNVKDMFWTDATGMRIPGSIVYNITSDWRYETATNIFSAVFTNDFVPDMLPPEPVTISNCQFAVLSSPIPLELLNAENTDLQNLLVPFGTPFTVAPGDSMVFPLQDPVPLGASVVLVYDVTGPNSSAAALDFVQISNVPEPNLLQLGYGGLLALLGWARLRR